MNHIKQDIRLKAWVDLGVGARPKLNCFVICHYGHVAYQIKGNENAAT